MPEPLSRHRTAFTPDFRVIVLRDIDTDADPGASTAINQLEDNIAVSSGYGVYVHAVQNHTPVGVDVEVWESAPPTAPVASGWERAAALEFDAPSGYLLVGDNMGAGTDGIDPPAGAGRYAVEVWCQGRADIQRVIEQWLSTDLHDPTTRALLDDNKEKEQYLLRLWWNAELDDDDDDI
ncbi:hypothetical protein [Symbioplanes lichenis]|uniref:hypothetical protein n=1 Tax=Symbioplanes lichenis TaxID=1629072 RepID=UPI0027387555|nr:hypothetical protein [Actinoplanes lichenis]